MQGPAEAVEEGFQVWREKGTDRRDDRHEAIDTGRLLLPDRRRHFPSEYPLNIRPDALGDYRLYVYNIQNSLVHDKIGWRISLQRRDGHMFYIRGEDILFTLPELKNFTKDSTILWRRIWLN